MSIEISSSAAGKPIRGAVARDFLSPFDGSKLARVFEAGVMDLIQSLAATKKALQEAESAGPLERAKWMKALSRRIH